MSAEEDWPPDDQFFIERVARALKFERLSRALFDHPKYGSVLLLGAAAAFDVFVLSLRYDAGAGVYRVDNPGAIALLLGWPIVVLVMIDIRGKYSDRIDELPEPDPEIDLEVARPKSRVRRVLHRLRLLSNEDVEFHSIAPTGLKIALGVLALLVHFAWVFTDPPTQRPLAGIAQLQWSVKFYFYIPLTYYVAGTEFLSMFLGVHLLMPFRIQESGRIDFTDPHRFGGLREIGLLLRRSAALYLGLAILFVIFVALPGGVNPLDRFPLAIVLGGTTLGALLFFAPVYWLHRHMRALKETKIEIIANRMEKDIDPENEFFPDIDFESVENVSAYMHEYIALTRVEGMREYPVDISIIQEFLFVLALPYVAHVSSTIFFEMITH